MPVRFSARALAAAILLLCLAAICHAQQPDPTFGNNGLVVSNLAPSFPSCPYSCYVVESPRQVFYDQPTDRLIVFVSSPNYTTYGTEYSTGTFRFTANGVLEGRVSGVFGTFSEVVRLPNGKFLAIGTQIHQTPSGPLFLSSDDWLIARFNADASIDTSFDGDGRLTYGFSANNSDIAKTVAVQPDGKFIVLGTSRNPASALPITIMSRFNPDGSIDGSFGRGGFIDWWDGGGLSEGILIQPDGKIIIAGDNCGDYTQNAPCSITLVRFLENGEVDGSFGPFGFVSLEAGRRNFFRKIERQPDGKIVVFGNGEKAAFGSSNLRETNTFLKRIDINGSADGAFGNGGTVTLNQSPYALNQILYGREYPLSMLIEENGNILVANSIDTPGRRSALAISRFDPQGKLIDQNYSRLTRDSEIFMDASGNASSLLKFPDGKILQSGTRYDYRISSSQPFTDTAMYRWASLSAKKNANVNFDLSFTGAVSPAVYRAGGSSTWYVMKSPAGVLQPQFGQSGDIIAPADYDGDGISEIAVFRPSSGEWIKSTAYRASCTDSPCQEATQWGAAGDIPSPGDFDGDGASDYALFRPSNGSWWILKSGGGYTALQFGRNGDQPVSGDFDGDGRSDIAVIRREGGQMVWYILQSSDGNFAIFPFGLDTDKAVAADYNGDGRTEVAVWRAGTWYIFSNYTDITYATLGSPGDLPQPADFDGDKKADIAVYRPSAGTHYIINSGNGNTQIIPFGVNGDQPIAGAYVR